MTSSIVAKDDVAALLKPLVSDAEDLDFVARCIVTEGPLHHRLASFALLKLLALAMESAGARGEPAAEGLPLPLRLPPHLPRGDDADAHYPLTIPLRALSRLAPPGSREASALAAALMDGPPHHALANAAMVSMLDALIEHLSKKEGE